MKMIIEIDPVEEKDYAQIIANINEVCNGLFEMRYNFRKRFEWRIETDTYKSQYELLDAMLEEIYELFPNVDVE